MPDIYQHDPDILPQGVHAASSCPPLALLRALREEVLPADLARDVAAHSAACNVCQTLLVDLEQYPQPSITSIERNRIRQKVPLIAPTRNVGWRWYAIASAAAALILAAVLLVVRQTEHPTVAQITPPETQQAQTGPASAKQRAPEDPSNNIQIAKLSPPLDLSPGLVLRGETTSTEPTPQQLAPAFDAYTRNDYPLAAKRFSQLAKQFPRSGTPFLYLGVTELLTDDNANALFNLTRAEQFISPSQRDAASWYRVVAALRTGSPNTSQLIHALCIRDSSDYAHQACQLEQTRSN